MARYGVRSIQYRGEGLIHIIVLNFSETSRLELNNMPDLHLFLEETTMFH